MSLLESTPAPKTAQMFHTERFVCSFKHIYKTPLKLEGSFLAAVVPYCFATSTAKWRI